MALQSPAERAAIQWIHVPYIPLPSTAPQPCIRHHTAIVTLKLAVRKNYGAECELTYGVLLRSKYFQQLWPTGFLESSVSCHKILSTSHCGSCARHLTLTIFIYKLWSTDEDSCNCPKFQSVWAALINQVGKTYIWRKSSTIMLFTNCRSV